LTVHSRSSHLRHVIIIIINDDHDHDNNIIILPSSLLLGNKIFASLSHSSIQKPPAKCSVNVCHYSLLSRIVHHRNHYGRHFVHHFDSCLSADHQLLLFILCPSNPIKTTAFHCFFYSILFRSIGDIETLPFKSATFQLTNRK
jgi:hypothetical protein